MRGSRVLFMRRAIADMAIQNDQSRPVLRIPENLQRVLDAVEIICIADSQHIPAIRKKSSSDILCKGDTSISFNRDVVVVINPAEVIEAQMSGERCRF